MLTQTKTFAPVPAAIVGASYRSLCQISREVIVPSAAANDGNTPSRPNILSARRRRHARLAGRY